MPLITDMQIKKFNDIILNFMWDEKRNKIPLAILQNPKDKGGLKLVNIKEKNHSLHMQWVKKIINDDQYQYTYSYIGCKKMGALVWNSNLNSEYARNTFKSKTFWTDLIIEWSEINFHNTHKTVPKF